ncbi:hypothetical protein [Bacillus licheniformis]|uniref:hypothetical protein n=1 Tax=Bacillus licheniformis TaxID=1402 RepID=UPI000AF6C832|nr:hypothetical protein [Bacillus licheniformis]
MQRNVFHRGRTEKTVIVGLDSKKEKNEESGAADMFQKSDQTEKEKRKYYQSRGRE